MVINNTFKKKKIKSTIGKQQELNLRFFESTQTKIRHQKSK